MPTVKQTVDDLVNGRMTLQQACNDFASRQWPPPPPRPTIAQQYGVQDDIPEDDPNSWAMVANDSRLTPEQYAALYNAVP